MYPKIYFIKTISWICFIIAFIQSQNEAFASHAQSADLTYECLGGNQYRLTLSFYRDCAGTTAPNSVPINASSASCNQNLNITLNQVPGTGQDVTPICPTMTTQCTGGSNPGVQEYIYSGIINLPMQCTDWVFSFSLCCRNASIGTINNPSGENIYVESHLNNLNFPCNSSPVFSNPPIPFVCVGQPYCFNHGATDPDGDSLTYTLVAPATGPSTTVTYVSPYSPSQPIASSPAVSFNNLTGDICMTPTQIQVTVLAVLVQEWRAGVLVGSVVRDIQLRTIPCNNNNPYVDGINGTNQYSLTACAGSNISFNINTFDIDASQNVTITWNNAIAGATFTTSGGSRPVATFNWTPTAAQVSNTSYCFTITVSDNNCPYNGSQTYSFCITVTGLSLTTTATPANCGASNGTATATVSGGAGPYTYQWSPGGGNNSTATGLAAGNYNVLVTDAAGCSVTASVTVPVGQANSNLNITATNVSCNGGNNGSATANVSGGQQPYTYLWSNSSTAQTITNLTPGSYSLTVTNGAGCITTGSITITQPLFSLSASSSSTSTTCFGSSNGTGTVVATGGTSPYSYIWSTSPLQTTQTATGLAAGNYNITVIDNNGCTAALTVTVNQPSPVSPSVAQITSPSCNGGSNGTATGSATGGSAPYVYSWNTLPSQNGITANNLSAGNYILSVSDNNGCTGSIPFSVTQPLPVSVNFSSIANVSCNGGSNGSATAGATGGTSPYSYTWTISNQAVNSATANNLAAGNYNVTATDANGCTASNNVTINQPSPLTATMLSTTNVSCNGGNNGAATAAANGGTSPYTYSWNTVPAQVNNNANTLTAGNYTATITDQHGCTTTASVIISEPLPIVTSATGNATICPNQQTPVNASATGGNGNYNYYWQPSIGNGPSYTVSPAATTSYSVTAIDALGCTGNTATITVNVLQLSPQNLSVSAPISICQGSSAQISAMVTGVPQPVYFAWSPNIGTTGGPYAVAPSSSTTYVVTVTDNCANQVSASIPVTVNPLPIVTVTPQSGSGCDEVGFNFTDPNPGNSNATHQWSFGDGSYSFASPATHAFTLSGTYIVTLTVTSAQGCTDSSHAAYNVTVYTSPKAEFGTSASEVSILDPTVHFFDQSQNAIAWDWDFGDGNTSTLQDPFHTYAAKGTYTARLIAYSTGGCSDTTTEVISVNPETTIYIPNAFTPNGDGKNDVFTAEGIEITKFKMMIFDRWGEMIFASDDIEKGWDGRAKMGSGIAQEGVYVYKIRVTNFRGLDKEYTGHISLLK